MDDPSLTMGIEEEYLLIDPETLDLAADPPESLLERAQALAPDQLVTPEFLRAQIEVGTRVCATVAEVRAALVELRRAVRTAVGEHGLAFAAASTHPFAEWSAQHPTRKERYETLARDLQSVVRRLLICGMHVHVCIEDDELRIDIMNQVRYFLPHLLALTTSSPFWQGRISGLQSYRLTVFDALPRTGMPEAFSSWPEYDRLVQQFINAGVIEDASKLWWDIRPSAKYPTLEMRVADVCTEIDDAIAVAALYLCLIRMLIRLKRNNQRWRIYPAALIRENRWLAMRHGATGKLVDFGKGQQVPYADLIEEIFELVAEDAEALGCQNEIRHARTIAMRGTSASRQLKLFEERKAAGDDDRTALKAVVADLVERTGAGLD
ncbi:MAG: carboxylate-amine ligase [Minwuia sp.]|uniref:carboxylate-amine ligase n=1 Tax=Minwuia sp. TaxID=2493630 RepID=UPI003A8BF8ED